MLGSILALLTILHSSSVFDSLYLVSITQKASGVKGLAVPDYGICLHSPWLEFLLHNIPAGLKFSC